MLNSPPICKWLKHIQLKTIKKVKVIVKGKAVTNLIFTLIHLDQNNLIQINLGPQHPSTHGVLRIIAFVECETIKSVEPELGLLHRGSEKLIEYRC